MKDSLLLAADPDLRALGLALVHSIWQGAAVALIAAVFLKKTASADGRYRIGMASLLAVLGAAVATFFFFFEKENWLPGASGFKILQLDGGPLAIEPGMASQLSEPSIWERATAWFEANHALVVGLWMLGAAFFLVKLVGGWLLAEQMRTRWTRPVLADFGEILTDLLKKMPVAGPVHLLESAVARVPMTLGWLRPVILLPVGLVNNLTVEEVEFVLAHELAHIARRDWLANIAQAVVESLFYFNPAVWWLSARIREERENVADDLALSITGGPAVGYAKTLVRVQEAASTTSQPALALAFSGKKKPELLARVRRIVFQSPPSKNFTMEKMLATGLIVALAAVFSLRANPDFPVSQKLAQLAENPAILFQNAVAVPDSAAPKARVKMKGDGFVNANADGKTVQINYRDGEVSRLVVNGEEVPKTDFGKYDKLIELPAPPSQPSPFSTPFPAFPQMAPMPPMPTLAPMAPMPPAMPDDIWMSGTLNMYDDSEFSTTDGQGRLHIHLNGKGGKNEVVVDGGRAFLNGKPLETGQKTQILKRSDTNDFVAITGDGQVFQLKDGELTWNPQDPELRVFIAQRQKEAAEEQARAVEEEARAAAEEARAVEQERRLYRHEERAAQREARAEEREARVEELEARAAAMADRKRAAEGWGWSNGGAEARAFGTEGSTVVVTAGGDGQNWLREQLAADGFNPLEFSISLSNKSLKINGKKRDKEMHQRYLERYYANGGGRPGSSFSISVSEDSGE